MRKYRVYVDDVTIIALTHELGKETAKVVYKGSKPAVKTSCHYMDVDDFRFVSFGGVKDVCKITHGSRSIHIHKDKIHIWTVL